MDMEIIQVPLTLAEFKAADEGYFPDMVKGVVDVERSLLAVNADLHSDLEALLLENGSKQESLWGINLYPDLEGEDLVEFDSLINIRPLQGNRSRGVENPDIQKKIWDVVKKWIMN